MFIACQQVSHQKVPRKASSKIAHSGPAGGTAHNGAVA
jgi:hypothetical protein